MRDAREELRRAHAARQAAERAREDSRQAVGRGRELLETVIRDIERLDADERRRADEIADRLRCSISSGTEAELGPSDKIVARNMASRAELETRRTAIERTVSDFAAAEHEAERRVERAKDAVGAAIQDVLRSEVETIVASWMEAERSARTLRIKLGCKGDAVWSLSGHSAAGRRATYQNQEDVEFDFQQRQIASDPWIEFSAALLENANARLGFIPADRAIEDISKERAEHRAAGERYIASLPGEAA
jgi:hypothetical protein